MSNLRTRESASVRGADVAAARGRDSAAPRLREPDPDFMESLARGLSVIKAFGHGKRRLSGAEVAAITGLSRAAARRCLHTLAVLGYATAADGAFELTPAVLLLGQTYVGPASVATVAQPVLERLSARLQESTGVAVLDREDIVFVARAAARRILSVEVSVGGRLPAAHTASGRILLAHTDQPLRAALLSKLKLRRLTPRSIADRGDLEQELERVRTQGYSVVDQELELGLRSMAVPIRRHDGAVLAALNVGVQAARIDVRAMLRDFRPQLQAAAAEIGRGLG